MLGDSNLISIGLAAATAVSAGVFAFLRDLKRQRYLLLWAAGWCLFSLHHVAGEFASQFNSPAWLWFLEKWLLAAAALVFFSAALEYTQRRPRRSLEAVAATALVLWTIAYNLQKVAIAPEYGMAAVFFATSWICWQYARHQESRMDHLLAASFLILGLLPVAEWHFGSLTGMPSQISAVLIGAPQLLGAALMLMAAYERENARIERDMLALSNLHLTASSLLDGEAEKVLLPALQRVLSVVGFPAGGVLLRRGDVRGKKLVVTVGLDDAFCAALQEEPLHDYLVQLTARLGGLAVFRDLDRDASWSALEREEMFARFRRLALSQSLQAVVGISLQSKEPMPGVLLLAAPDNRGLTPSDFRLLTALGQQMGMAADNSCLMQNAWRRSEELHVLNEIGQALSSTLEPEALFEKIYTEMQRLFEVNGFYIAMLDEANGQIRFELEVADGVRLPQRSRPVGNHLTEYILRSRQPVLICEHFTEEMKKLGVEPIQQPGSFCGVPLVVYDRGIGVMAMRGLQEHLFDEGHLKILRVLANQASIALENARLLREEQTRARHLALLNNISRNAIAMLHPDEMLARIAEQLEHGLVFDHMGIGLLDHTTKEVMIHAEAGRRRGALGRRLKLGGSLVGRVARTGQMTLLRDAAVDADAKLVLEDSASAVALPIIFAEHIHGVLYVETAEPKEFSEEELLLLHTLADLISGALHHALTLQKAQEQAVTDGLTGVKTHRFLMESLSAEWKRSARASRPFCLLLADLDRFKFVNDFFGHLEGDLVLKRVGRILEQNCRRSDVVARYGGDEFVILMPESDIEQGRQIAEKLRACILNDSFLREKNVTASLGIAGFPAHGSTPQELLQIADASMYLSKHQGGNTVSTAGHLDPDEARQWKRDVLEAYLGVTLKRLFSTGPEAFAEIHRRLQQFSNSLPGSELALTGAPDSGSEEGPAERPSLTPAVIETVTSLALAIDAKDPYTQGHSPKVANYAALIAEGLGLKEDEIEQIRLGGMLHDIGKVGVPEQILNKNGPLNPEEWELMKEHVRFGHKLLEPLRTLASVRAMVLHHHEMFDGSGYPEGRAGEEIPLGARIIAIADAYDTITSDRTYKKARAAHAALAEIERCAGAQFDPHLVGIFVEAVQDFSKVPAGTEAIPVREAAL
jgi:diguanylate cyclase (GGDEF)-like protein/putative nucleotidyltransferase with HDIG domain